MLRIEVLCLVEFLVEEVGCDQGQSVALLTIVQLGETLAACIAECIALIDL